MLLGEETDAVGKIIADLLQCDIYNTSIYIQ